MGLAQRWSDEAGKALHRVENLLLAQAPEVKNQANVRGTDCFYDFLQNVQTGVRAAKYTTVVAHHR